jgi:hypothetical protein
MQRGSVRWKVMIFLVGLTLAAGSLVLRPWLRDQLAGQMRQSLDAVEGALVAGDTATAVELAELAVVKARKADRLLGESLLALGIARSRQADEADAASRLTHFEAASSNLLEARRVGVPAGDEPKLIFHMACCLHARNQLHESVPLLHRSLSLYPAGRARALHLLTLAYLDPSQLQLEMAAWANSELLRTPGLARDQLLDAWQTRVALLDRLGRPDMLTGIDPAQSPDTAWVATLVGVCEAYDAKRFDMAMSLCRQLAETKRLPQPVERRNWYLLGLSAAAVGELDTAMAALQTVEWRFANTPESPAAAAESATLHMRRGEAQQAVAAFGRAATYIATIGESVATIHSAKSIAKLMASAIEQLREQGEFESAVDLIAVYRQGVGPEAGESLEAGLYEAWAAALISDADSADANESERLRYRAHELLRRAGSSRVRLAALAESPEVAAESLWFAAQDFVEGEGFVAAVDAIERLLTHEAVGQRRADALALACAALEGCGKTEFVPDVAEQCITEFPRHPAALRACYHLARCQIASGELEAAEHSLRTVVTMANTATDVIIVHKSRLFLAHLLNDMDRPDAAIPEIQELLSGPIDADLDREARLLFSDCLRRRAQRPADQLAESNNPQVRSHYQQRKQQDLDEALGVLSALERELAAIDRTRRLSSLQADWLQQCRTSMAECLYESDRYEDAAALYQAIGETYNDTAVWLEAQVQVANCCYRLGQNDSAQSVLRAAQTRIDQLAPDEIEHLRLGMSPQRWEQWTNLVRRL